MLLQLIQVFFAVFGVLDPVGNTPVFMSLTARMDRAKRRRLATAAVLRAALILVIFVFGGVALLNAFHISLESFRIAGGIIASLIGLQIVFGIEMPHDKPEHEEDIGVVPLAMPLIAGPGMLTLAVILTKEYGYALTLAGIGANLVLTKVLFDRSETVIRMLGRSGSHMLVKVMGLILLGIGIEFIRSAFIGA